MNEKARELDFLPELKQNSLPSVCKLADSGYTTIFHSDDGVVTVHFSEDIAIKVKKEAVLQWWRDKSWLLWVHIKYKVEDDNTDTLLIDSLTPQYAINNLHELAS